MSGCVYCCIYVEENPGGDRRGYVESCECGNYNLMYDKVKGEIFCPNCGLVYAEKLRDIDAVKNKKPIKKGEYTPPQVVCEICGHRYINRPKRTFGRFDFSNDYCDFCSSIIQWTASRYGERKDNIGSSKGGVSFEPYCSLFNEEFKERVRGFWSYKCGVCGLTEKENGRKLSVHHVDYDKKSCCEISEFNSTPNLFIPLCDSHHSKTNFNRKYWEEMLSNYIMIYFDGECFLSKEEADIY